MNNYIFSIDQSITCTAWCYFINDELYQFGCIKTSKEDGSLFDRTETICDSLKKMGDLKRMVLCREGLGFGGSKSNASRDLAYLVGAIERTLETPFEEVAPTALKKFATGSGKADKQQMIDSLPEDIKLKFLNAGYKKTTGLSDLADAYFIGKYFMEN